MMNTLLTLVTRLPFLSLPPYVAISFCGDAIAVDYGKPGAAVGGGKIARG